MDYLLFLICGLAFGCLGAMLGIGGGVIIVPVLTFLLGFTPQQAIGTSIFVVFLNAISGTVVYLKQKKVFMDAAVKFALATIPGSFLGSYISELLRGKTFYFVFGVFFIIFAIDMLRKAYSKGVNEENTEVPADYNWKLGAGYSVGIGFLASILGIGGGIMHVPMMTYGLHFPVKVAIATSTTILTVSTFAGVISHAYLGHINWITALCMGIGAAIGAQGGVQLAKKAKSTLLMKLIAFVIILMGLKFLAQCF